MTQNVSQERLATGTEAGALDRLIDRIDQRFLEAPKAKHRKVRFDYPLFAMLMSLCGIFFAAGLIVGAVR